MMIDSYKIDAFTKLSENVCLEVINLLQQEYGEIGHLRIEDNEVSFQVYKWCYEETQHVIKSENDKIQLRLIDKLDDPFYSLSYRIALCDN